jgi:predicted RNase H-like nuclease
VRFVGVDLAWGLNAWTGLAVLDAEGDLVLMERVRTDDEIVERLGPHLGGPAVVAVDAPLVVTNLTGRRSCEAQVSTVFGRFHAGAHSSNLSLPSFRGGPRGGRVAALLGLDVDPDFPPRQPVRRAIEVYPHPATVTLFGLDRVVPYKARPGRTAQQRRAALATLMQHVTTLASATPALRVDACAAWRTAERDVAAARTSADLNRWEDAVDAVLCAYVGLHRWWHGDAQSAVLGDLATGYIVVPLDERVRTSLASRRPERVRSADDEPLAVDDVHRTVGDGGSTTPPTEGSRDGREDVGP